MGQQEQPRPGNAMVQISVPVKRHAGTEWITRARETDYDDEDSGGHADSAHSFVVSRSSDMCPSKKLWKKCNKKEKKKKCKKESECMWCTYPREGLGFCRAAKTDSNVKLNSSFVCLRDPFEDPFASCPFMP